MIKKLYTVYDKKAQNCLGIFPANNDLVAIRDFSQTCSYKDEKNMINKFPEDYNLLCLGEFDEETGVITNQIRTIAEAVEYATKE